MQLFQEYAFFIFSKGQIVLQTNNAPLLPYYIIILLIFLVNLLKDLYWVTVFILVLMLVLMEHDHLTKLLKLMKEKKNNNINCAMNISLFKVVRTSVVVHKNGG